MNLYLNQIEQLVELQKVDDLIFALNQKLKNVPAQISSLQEEFALYDSQKTHIEDKIQHLNEQKKRISLVMDENTTRVSNSKTKLEQVENEREYTAVSRELDNMESQTKMHEEESKALKEEFELQESNLADIMVTWTSLNAQLEEAQAQLAQITQEAEAELARLSEARKETTTHIPAPILTRYEFIRKRLEHPVIVSVNAGICSGCNIAIPPQVYNELQRAQQIISCPNCQRLVFWEQHFKKEEAAEEVSSEAVEASESAE